jgi:hypothetical protein
MALTQPIKSRIQLEWTGVCLGVQRKHPSHYLQRVEGKIYAHPVFAETAIAIPDSAKQPQVIGTFGFWQAQIWQATCEAVLVRHIFAGRAKELNALFSHVRGDNGSFRQDLPIEPCNFFMALDHCAIADATYHHDTLLRECIQELVRVFAFIEVTVIDIKKVILPESILADMEFTKVSETPFAIRDNCRYYAARWDCPPMPPPALSAPFHFN